MDYTWNWQIFWQPVGGSNEAYWMLLARGLAWTVSTALAAWFLAFFIGIVVGTARTSSKKAISGGAYAFTEFFRNIPLLVQMFFWFFEKRPSSCSFVRESSRLALRAAGIEREPFLSLEGCF